MSYLVLARKYRPQSFEDVIGQEHITRTLANAISMGRMPHAVLFSGPRGTGKTTVARILAKSLNCEKGPAITPCNACASCREITNGSGSDVFEIDGASNNSVDQIRELRENAKYMPSHSRYKIYIIDEVHMLSIAAFNALLKILEEPPAHVLFFFATTEPHKIPVTILSRCQRHDFKRIGAETIVLQLKKLCEKEGFNMDTESLSLIAREAEGGMRDALSLLDQLMACADGDLSHEQLMDFLGIADQKMLFDLSEAVFARKIPKVIEIFDYLYSRGHDFKKLYQDILKHFRNLLVVKISENNDTLLDLPAIDISRLKDQVNTVSAFYLNQVIHFLFELDSSMRFSDQPKLVLEVAFIKLLQIQPVLPIDTLIEKLDQLGNGACFAQDPRLADLIPAYGDPDQPEPEIEMEFDPQASPEYENITGKATETMKFEDKGNSSDLVAAWKILFKAISAEHPSLAANLINSKLKALDGNDLLIEVNGNDFNLKRIKQDKNLALLKSVCENFFSRPINIVIEEKKTENDIQQKRDDSRKMKEGALNHPLVAEAIELFKGTIVEVKLI